MIFDAPTGQKPCQRGELSFWDALYSWYACDLHKGGAAKTKQKMQDIRNREDIDFIFILIFF